MQDELLEKLTSFGFTVNQAKVYLSIVQSSRTHVGKISKDTQLHRQDIYKLLPKLEQMGLIVKTIDKPFMIEALPIQRALENLITKEKEQNNQRILSLQQNLVAVSQAVQEQPEAKEEAHFTLLTTGEAMRNRSQQTFKRRRKTFNIVITAENLRSPAGHYYRDFFQQIADFCGKIRLLVVGEAAIDELRVAVEKSCPEKGDFKVKAIEKSAFKDYQIVDNKEVWIATQQRTPAGYPNILWTNDPSIAEAYSENFLETWNSHKAVLIYKSQAKPAAMHASLTPQLLTQ